MPASFSPSPRSVGMGEISDVVARPRPGRPNGALSYAEDNSSSIVQSPFEFSDIFNAFTNYV